MADSQQMEYRFLGQTGLKVSALGFGNWVTGGNPEFQETQNAIISRAWDKGINYFDTAEEYGYGVAEEVLGNSLKSLNVPREDLVISTKIFWGDSIDESLKNQVNRVGLSRKHIIEGTLSSLRRLQLDYADIIFCHNYDHETPVEETVRAFNWLIEQGKIFYWGTSNWSAEYIKESIGECNRLGLIKPIADQCQYNLLYRKPLEVDYSDLFDKYQYGTTTWSPLASGLLTGKYNTGIPNNSRIATNYVAAQFIYYLYEDLWGDDDKQSKTIQKINLLQDVANTLGATLPQLSIAWVLANKNVSTCLLGASNVSQLEENVKALEFVPKITPEVESKINDILANRPTPPTNWKTFSPLPYRR